VHWGKFQKRRRDKLRIIVIGETKKLIKRFSNTAGIGSRKQDLFGEEEINFRTSSVVSWRKSTRRVDGSATELVSIKNSWIKIEKSRALTKIKKVREITEALTNFYWLKMYPFFNPLLRHMRAINFLDDNEPPVW
jgi:hypothetical protein